MKIIAVDDEELALKNMLEILHKVLPYESIEGFSDPLEALAYCKKESIDIAFLDVEMYDMNGIQLAKEIQEMYEKANIIFSTSYDEYTMDAMEIHASGYIMKPITEQKVLKEMNDLRYLIADTRPESRKLKVTTFGGFEAYIDNEPIKFQYAKTKELLAYLIDRKGTLATNGEIIGILWGDDMNSLNKTSYLKNIRAELIKIFEKAELNDVIVHYRGMLGVRTELIDCDYYDYLRGDKAALNTYDGEYMSQYSWSEYTNGYLYEHQAE